MPIFCCAYYIIYTIISEDGDLDVINPDDRAIFRDIDPEEEEVVAELVEADVEDAEDGGGWSAVSQETMTYTDSERFHLDLADEVHLTAKTVRVLFPGPLFCYI